MVSATVLPFPAAAKPPRAKPESYPWLLTVPAAHVWIVRDGASNRTAPIGEERTATIDFRFRLPDGTLLTDPENAGWLRLAKRYAVLLREHELSSIQTATLHAQQVRQLFLLMAWMRLQRPDPIDHFEDLRPQDVKRFVHAAKHGVASVLDVAARASALVAEGLDLEDLGAVRRALHLPDQSHIKEEVAIAAGRSNGAERKPIVHNPLFRQLVVLEDLWAFRREITGDNVRFDPSRRAPRRRPRSTAPTPAGPRSSRRARP